MNSDKTGVADVELEEIVLNVHTDVTQNLLTLLEKKMTSLQIAARCHEMLAGSYAWRGRAINCLGIVVAGVSLVFSTVWGENKDTVNLPLAIASGVALVVKGSEQVVNYKERSRAHKQCHTQALDLADDIEYVILKNNHTRESLLQQIDVYEERIKSFRKSEEPIPVSVKLRAVRKN